MSESYVKLLIIFPAITRISRLVNDHNDARVRCVCGDFVLTRLGRREYSVVEAYR